MRVFLDANVLVSGFATRGLSADVVRLVLADHELATSEVVLEELQRILLEKFGVPEETVAEIDTFLCRYPVDPEIGTEAPVTVRDPDAERALAPAIASGAEVLVTGDDDLLAVADDVESVRILTPRAFWEQIRSPRSP